MKKNHFLPAGNAQRGIWLGNFKAKLTAALITKLGLSKEETDALSADTLSFLYSLSLTEAAKTFEHQCVTYQLALRNGPQGVDVVSVPVFSFAGVIPEAVVAGIFIRVSKLVKKIKASVNYTDDIGRALGIIGSEMEAKSANDAVKPILTGKMVAGEAQIKYTRGENDGIRLESKRGAENSFTLLDKINKTSYLDKRPTLVEGQPEKREYRAWFFVGDELVGQVSAVITVTVEV